MKNKHPVLSPRGYTLTEVILAMAVMAIAVPLILGLVVAGGESSRQAERETRAVMTARTVFEELRRARDGNSAFIEREDLPWGTNPINTAIAGVGGGSVIPGPGSGSGSAGDDEWLLFELNAEGEILAMVESMEYDDRWQGENPDVTGLAAVRGYMQEVDNVEVVDGEPLRVFRIEVRIESPARAEARYRERLVFLKSDSLQ